MFNAKVQINRFPVFSLWCYVVAQRLGYDEDEARSLAVTRAKLGAAAKAGYLARAGKSRPETVSVRYGVAEQAYTEPEQVEQVHFVGMQPYVVHTAYGLRGLLHSQDKAHIVEPEEFEDSTIKKLEKAQPGLSQELLMLLEELAYLFSPEELNGQAYRLWERFAPMVIGPDGRERKPVFGERCTLDTDKIQALIAEAQSKLQPIRHNERELTAVGAAA
jgi:hypothetical protein